MAESCWAAHPSPGLGLEPAISHSTALVLYGRVVNLVVVKQEPARGTIFSIFNNDPLVDEASFMASCKGERLLMKPWLILGVVNRFLYRVDTVCIIDSLFCGKKHLCVASLKVK